MHNTALYRKLLKDFKPYLSAPSRPIGLTIDFHGRFNDTLRVPRGAVRDTSTPDFEVYTKANLRYLSSRDGYARFDLETGCVEASLGRRMERSPTPRFFVKYSIIRGLERRKRPPLHSSAVTDGEHTRIFVGRTGSGKTTLLMLNLLHGKTLLTDDVLFLGNGAIYPFPMRANLHLNTINRLRRKNKFVGSHLKPGLVDLGAIFPCRRDPIQQSNISIYYLNVWRANRTKIRRVTPPLMLGQLTGSYVTEYNASYWYGWKSGRRISNAMRAYSEILKGADCYQVYAGSDLTHLYKSFIRTED